MFENLLDDHRVFNTGNDLHASTTVPAGFYVNPEYALQTLLPDGSNRRAPIVK